MNYLTNWTRANTRLFNSIIRDLTNTRETTVLKALSKYPKLLNDFKHLKSKNFSYKMKIAKGIEKIHKCEICKNLCYSELTTCSNKCSSIRSGKATSKKN